MLNHVQYRPPLNNHQEKNKTIVFLTSLAPPVAAHFYPISKETLLTIPTPVPCPDPAGTRRQAA